MYGAGGAAEGGRAEDTLEDTDPDLGQGLNQKLCPWGPQGLIIDWGQAPTASSVAGVFIYGPRIKLGVCQGLGGKEYCL